MMMKTLALGGALVWMLVPSVMAEDYPQFKEGDRLRVQAMRMLPDEPSEIRVIRQVGGWVLCEYQRTFTVRGESGTKTERAEIWVNLNHVTSVRVLPEK